MAIGKSEMQLDPDKIDIIIGSYPLLIKSQPTDYVEQELQGLFAK